MKYKNIVLKEQRKCKSVKFLNGENGNCFCFLNGGKNVLYRKKEKEVFVMFIYKKIVLK